MTLRLGDTAPDFEAETTEGKIKFHEWKDGSWAVLFSHPADFTPVCTTELGYMAGLQPQFAVQHQDHRAQRRPGLEPREVVQGHRGVPVSRRQLPHDR